MTGFGGPGRGSDEDHYGVRPDLLVAAKGATSGYWPVRVRGRLLGRRSGGRDARRRVCPRISGTTSAAAVAREVLRILETESLVEASAVKGEWFLGCSARVCGTTPPWAASAAAATASSAWSWSGTGCRRRRMRVPRSWSRPSTDRARSRAAALLGDRERERRRWRRRRAGAAVRGHGRRARRSPTARATPGRRRCWSSRRRDLRQAADSPHVGWPTRG